MLSINSPRLMEETSKPLNFEYRYFNLCNLWLDLTVFPGFRQIVINHAATIFSGLGDGGVTAFLVARDLVFSVQAFENQLARRDKSPCVGAVEVERNQRCLEQLRNRLEQVNALGRGSCIGEQKFVSFIKPLHGARKVDAYEIAFEDLAGGALDEIAGDAVRAELFAFILQLHLSGH